MWRLQTPQLLHRTGSLPLTCNRRHLSGAAGGYNLQQARPTLRLSPNPSGRERQVQTAFRGMSRKLWEWNVVPFGLKNAPPIFHRMMDRVLAELPFARCYIDDIVVWSNSFSEHLKHLEIVFNRLRDVGLKVHPGKCLFGAQVLGDSLRNSASIG